MTVRAWFVRLLALFRRRHLEQELNEDVRAHLEMAEEENLRRGMTPREARDVARRSFGGIEQVKEEYREARGIQWIETLVQDARYGLRVLARTPTFSLTALGTLALGIGAITAVFSIVYAVLLRALPYPDPDRLVWVTSVARSFPDQPEVALLADFVELREQADCFSHIAVFSTVSSNFADAASAERIDNARVTTEFLSTLGIQPVLGRDFVRAEEEPGNGRVVILTHGYWQQRFGADEKVVGREIMLDGEPYTVVGVLPPRFVFPLASAFDDVKLLRPLEFDVERERQRTILRFHFVVARLAPNVSIEAARSKLDVIRAWIDQQAPKMREWDLAMVVRPLHDHLVGEVRHALLILFGAVACVLCIACINVANLLLARSTVRQREIATRGALGAGRLRLVRQLLTENVLLAAGGCLAGVVLSVFLRQGLAAIRPAALYHSDISEINVAVLMFAVTISGLTAIAFGILPAFSASGTAPMNALKAGVRHASVSPGRRGLLSALVAGQLSLALVLLVSAGLMGQSFQRLRFEGLGFRTEGVLTTSVSLDRTRYQQPQQQQSFFVELVERARALPGVREAALSAGLPPSGASYCMTLYAEGTAPPEKPTEAPCVPHQPVSPSYFAALEIPLLKGRLFSGQETTADSVAVVNSTFARSYYGTVDPIGKRFRAARGDFPWRSIVGVVADTRNRGMSSEPEPHVYTPFHAEATSSGSLIATTSGPADSLGPALRQLVHDIDPQQAMADIETFDQRLTREVSRERFLTWVLTAFASLAATLAATGVYGVVAYMVQQRRQEIGVRLALGAEPRDILRQFLTHGAKLLAMGAVLGLVGSFAATRLLQSYLFQTSATDWRTFTLSLGLLTAVTALACYWPARRASGTDPLSALRYD